MTAPIRTVTVGVAEPHPLTADAVAKAVALVRRCEATYRDAGYEVQTVRLSTRPVFLDLADRPAGDLLQYARELQGRLDEAGIAFCSLGTAPAWSPDFPLEVTDIIPELLAGSDSLNATVQVASPGASVRLEAARAAARSIGRLAGDTSEGFGNFRFAALACVPPWAPFFPAAYHAGPTSISVGVQGAGIVRSALGNEPSPIDLAALTERVRDALEAYAASIVEIGERLARQERAVFGGIDLSPAPMGEDSIVEAIEAASGEPFGSAGTLATVAALTAAIKKVELHTCGYNGIMLPVLEDAVLGRRWEEKRVDVRSLLLYSAVCGTGLDMVPLPGDSSTDEIARLLLDLAELAVRLNKPLSARLLPVPDTHAGDKTSFTSPYLTNTIVKEI
jgi:uncharacterized protein (UPF0210 family)